MSYFKTIKVSTYIRIAFYLLLLALFFQNCSGSKGSSTSEEAVSKSELSEISSSILEANSYSSSAATIAATSSDTLFYVLAGQSNMEGYGNPAHINESERMIPSNVTFYLGSQKQSSFGQDGHFGPEVGVARMLGYQFPSKRIVIVKYALGGTSLKQWVLGAQANDGTTISGSGNLFIALRDHLATVFTRDFAGRDNRVSGFFWMQGESDANEFDSLGFKYATNMQKFFTQIPNYFPLANDFRFVMGRIHSYKTSAMLNAGLTYRQINWPEHFIHVRREQTNLSPQFAIRIVSTDQLTLSDIWHFDSHSAFFLGHCLGQAYFANSKHHGCTKYVGRTDAYSGDAFSDSRVEELRYQIKGLYTRILKREADDDGLRYWLTEVYNGRHNLATVEQFMLSTLPSCSAQSLASVIDGKCHFNFSCTSYQQAVNEIAGRKAAYSSCSSAVPVAHNDCMNAFGAARGYIAACPLMRSNEQLLTNGSTTTGRVADLFKIYRKRNPDVDGLNYWVQQINSGAATEAALIKALQ